MFNSVHWKAIGWSRTLTVKEFFIFGYVCFDMEYVCRVEFSNQEKAAIFFEVLIWKLTATALQIRITLRFLWLWIFPQLYAVLPSFFPIENTEEQKKLAWRIQS